MVFDTSLINKRVQYITVDSEFVTGSNNVFSVNFGTSTTSNTSSNAITGAITVSGSRTTGSNIFVQEMRNVIGLKLVDFYVTQVGTFEVGNVVTDSEGNVVTTSNTNTLAVKYIDILCPDLPDTAQILDERKSKIFARIPLERDFSGSSNTIVNDKQWKSFSRQTNYFNPISITKLNFQMFELTGNNATSSNFGTYQPLQPDAQFYMILEVTTIDYESITLPKEDNTIKVVKAIESLEKRFISLFEELPDMIKAGIPVPVPVVPLDPIPIAAVQSSSITHSPVPQPPPEEVPERIVPPKKIDTKMYIIIALVILFIAYLFSKQ